MIRTCDLKYDTVDSEYLDCLNDNLAVLLLHLGVTDVRTPFACQWYFDFDPARDNGAPRLENVPVADVIYEQSGCRIRNFPLEPGGYAETCAGHLAESRPVLIFGDAYFMPWLPYFGRQHMEHSFILDGLSADHKLLHLVDAYKIRTEWGDAEPTDTYIPTSALDRIIQELTTPSAQSGLVLEREREVVRAEPRALLANNAAQMATQLETLDMVRRFSAHYRARMADAAAMKEFTLACWLVARARKLHGLWLADVAAEYPDLLDPEFVTLYDETVSLPWQKVAEFSYILSRRVSGGRSAPDSCFSMLEETIHPNEIAAAKALGERMAG